MSAKPYFDDGKGHVIYHGDCREILPTLGKFDLVLTDPPYGIDAAKGKAHSSIRDNDKWPKESWDKDRAETAVKMAWHVGRNVAIWGGNYYAHILPSSGAWLAWIKPEAETGFSLSDMELCWTDGDFSPRIKTLPRRDGNQHPTQKPVDLMKWCCSFFPKAKTVIDPFMGSGTTLRACKDLGIACTGIELEEKYCEISARRLEQEVFDFGAQSA